MLIVKKLTESENTSYLTVFSPEGEILTQSAKSAADQELRVKYEDLEYVCNPNGEIMITLDSINRKFKKSE